MSGILAIWNDCDPAVLSDYERWYAQEHLPERHCQVGSPWPERVGWAKLAG